MTMPSTSGLHTILISVQVPYDVGMKRLGKFEHNRYIGDKRSQVVYDIDELAPEYEPLIEELLAAETFICFGPDTLTEANNRCYQLFHKQRAAAAAD